MTFKILLLFVPLSMGQFSLDEIFRANNYFANNMYQQLSGKSENVFFSPLSAHAVLSLVAQGAAGETRQEFDKILDVNTRSSAAGYHSLRTVLRTTYNVTLNIANKIYVQRNLKMKQQFKEVASNHFLAEAESINFDDSQRAAQNINGWCSRMTHNKITDLVSPQDLTPLTNMLLLNAVYFKGLWDSPFDKKLTNKAPFYVNERETITVDMMYSQTGSFSIDYNAMLRATILKLNYQNKDVSMVIVLPDEKYGIKALEQKITNYNLLRLDAGVTKKYASVIMPKFKIESKMQLTDALVKMGIKKAFTHEADFSNLLDSQMQCQISKVIQKTFIEVTEEGTEAAAASGAEVVMLSASPVIRIDHPFILLIQIEAAFSKTALFYGRITRPSAK